MEREKLKRKTTKSAVEKKIIRSKKGKNAIEQETPMNNNSPKAAKTTPKKRGKAKDNQEKIGALEKELTQCEIKQSKTAKKQKHQITLLRTQIEELKEELAAKETPKKIVKKRKSKSSIGSTKKGNDGLGELLVFGALSGLGYFVWKSYQDKQDQENVLAILAAQTANQEQHYQYYLDNGYTKETLDSIVNQGFILLTPAPNGDLQYR